jgi:F0F1-type ATP synthase delta subunit
MELNRSEVARALAKAIAYAACGKQSQAEEWARELCRLLGVAGILRA